MFCVLLGLSGCNGGLIDGSGGGGNGPNTREVPPNRTPARLTADQYVEALAVATGQRWDEFDEYAAALGKPDYRTTVDQNRDISAGTFKLFERAALETCNAAVDADRTVGGQGTIVRHVGFGATDRVSLVENLKYLLLRFLALDITSDADTRLDRWLEVLTTPTAQSGERSTEDDMTHRWKAVCVGLATHPDFLAY